MYIQLVPCIIHQHVKKGRIEKKAKGKVLSEKKTSSIVDSLKTVNFIVQ